MRFLILITIAALLVSAVKAASLSQPSERKLDINVDVDSDPDTSYILFKPDAAYLIEENKSISVDLSIYRGATLKRTVYIWIEDSEGNRISSKEKFSLPTRFTQYKLQANFSFPDLPACNRDSSYIIIAEGLDLYIDGSIDIAFDGCETTGTIAGQDQKISFSILSHPEKVTSGTPFKTRIYMSNPTEEDLEVDAWSYVYRSSKCYSGEREANRKKVNLPSHANVTFDIENTVIADEGDYLLKVKLLRSDRKTGEEFTFDIKVFSGNDTQQVPDNKAGISLNTDSSGVEISDVATKRSLVESNLTKPDSGNRSGIVYRSSSAKARGLIVYFLIAVLALVLVALVFKRI